MSVSVHFRTSPLASPYSMSQDDRRLPSISNQLPEHFRRTDPRTPSSTYEGQSNSVEPSPKRRISEFQAGHDLSYRHQAKRSNSAFFDPVTGAGSSASPSERYVHDVEQPSAPSRLPSLRTASDERWTQGQEMPPRHEERRPVQLPPIHHIGGSPADLRLPPLTASNSADERRGYSTSSPSSYGPPGDARYDERVYPPPAAQYGAPTSHPLQQTYSYPGTNVSYLPTDRRQSMASSLSSPRDERPPIPYGGPPPNANSTDASSQYTWEMPGTGVDASNRKRRGNLPKESTAILNDWFSRHSNYPYPKEEEKQQLQRETGLTMSQISNWFINARRRRARPMGGPGQSPTGDERGQR